MSNFKRVIAGSGLALVLAVGFGLTGSTAASAAGSCTSFGVNSGNMSPRCTGTVTIKWKCSSDLANTVSSKTLKYGSGYSTKTFRACNIGNPRDYYAVG